MKRENVDLARKLRRQSTAAERKFWNAIRSRQLGAKFRRQWPIGNYVVDFICLEVNLVIEIDGGQHNDNTRDMERTRWLESRGFRVIRFWNNDVLENLDGVLQRLQTELEGIAKTD